MTTKPPYVVRTLAEKEMTVDWFFGRGHWATKVKQFFLILVGWFFALLPVAVTAWALAHRDGDTRGLGSEEAFAIWDETMAYLSFFFVFLAVGFMGLFIANRVSSKRRNQRRTYDEEGLSRRLALAEAMYDEKFGPRELRVTKSNVQIQPYGDIETFELRGLYRNYGGE